jgi:hypothetical protein
VLSGVICVWTLEEHQQDFAGEIRRLLSSVDNSVGN